MDTIDVPQDKIVKKVKNVFVLIHFYISCTSRVLLQYIIEYIAKSSTLDYNAQQEWTDIV